MKQTSLKTSKIIVFGSAGMVGSAIVRALKKQGYKNIIESTRADVDLTVQSDVNAYFEKHKPEYVFLAAAKVGGILANKNAPADFITDNLQIQSNVICAAYRNGVKKLLFLGSSCIYPRDAKQPIREDELLTGELEKTNEAYAIAKIAGMKMCEYYNKQHGTDYITCMPTNLYGRGDTYDEQKSHVIPALIMKIHKAKIENAPQCVIWGTGTARREFLFVDDLAAAVIFLMNNYSGNETVNVGTGKDITIANLAEIIARVVGYKGKIVYDTSKPDGTPRKLLDITKLSGLGWKYSTELLDGIKIAYGDYLRRYGYDNT